MAEKKRIEWIDIAKGLLIILVVMGHVTSSYHAANMYSNAPLLNFSHQLIYSFHMPAFMFISGLLFRAKTDKKSQVKNILLSYGVPYLFFSFLWWIFKFVLSGIVNSQLGLTDLLLIPVFPISFMWFIYALLIIEIIQVVIGDKLNRSNKIIHVGVCFILYILSSMLSNVELFGSSYVFSDCIVNDVMKNSIFFVLGVYLGKRILSKKICSGGHTLLYTLALLALNVVNYKFCIKNIFTNACVAMIGIIWAVSFCQIIKSKLLSYVGKRTLCIYVLQGYCIAMTRIVLTKMGLNDTIGIMPMLVCTFVAINIPIFIYEICKKIVKIDFVFTPGRYIKL